MHEVGRYMPEGSARARGEAVCVCTRLGGVCGLEGVWLVRGMMRCVCAEGEVVCVSTRLGMCSGRNCAYSRGGGECVHKVE